MTDIAKVTELAEPTLRPTPARLFADCALLGLTAWGGFMALLAQAQERFVKQRQWVSEKEFLDLIALVTMPGWASTRSPSQAIAWRAGPASRRRCRASCCRASASSGTVVQLLAPGRLRACSRRSRSACCRRWR
jgi:hypothetical protein